MTKRSGGWGIRFQEKKKFTKVYGSMFLALRGVGGGVSNCQEKLLYCITLEWPLKVRSMKITDPALWLCDRLFPARTKDPYTQTQSESVTPT